MATKPLKNNTAETQGAGRQNSNLRKAAAAKNDEFYTRLVDIEAELKHYKKHFKDQTVFCNCDDPEASNFWKFFELNFERLGLKGLFSTHYAQGKASYKLELTRRERGGVDKIKTALSGDGDFRSPECVDILRKADLVVTNPPFSLFREYLTQIVEHGKRFIVIGNSNSISYKEVFPLLRDDKVWLGVESPKVFIRPDGTEASFGNICWFTNLANRRRAEEIILFAKYSSKLYPKYENFDAIEVGCVADIPCDYPGQMGVPITFLSKYNPTQFEILDINPHFFTLVEKGIAKPTQLKLAGRRDPYARLIVKRRTS
jgi:hypothetical protein